MIFIISSVFLVFVFLILFWKRKQHLEMLASLMIAQTKEKEFEQIRQVLGDKLEEKEKLITELKIEKSSITVRMEELKNGLGDKIAWLESSKEKLLESFKAVSFESLEKNNQAFLTLANQTFEKFQEKAEGSLDKKNASIAALFDPMKVSLSKLGDGFVQLEKERKTDHDLLKGQLKHMVDVEKELKEETSKLVRALRMPVVRGRWGEMQLRRVVELCGMVNHCDFFEQQQTESLRPDMVIRLPGDKQVIVDAKTPFEAYFDAMQTENNEKKEALLQLHAKHLRAHIAALSKKAYWENFEPTPEFVVLFLPSESFFSAALEQDPSLIEVGIDQKVVIATPVTLIGLLRAIAYGWKQEQLSRHTKDIYELGKELYKRTSDMHHHVTRLGKSLSTSVENYNKMIGSWESRVLVSARKFEGLGIGQPEGIDISRILDERPRELLAQQNDENAFSDA